MLGSKFWTSLIYTVKFWISLIYFHYNLKKKYIGNFGARKIDQAPLEIKASSLDCWSTYAVHYTTTTIGCSRVDLMITSFWHSMGTFYDCLCDIYIFSFLSDVFKNSFFCLIHALLKIFGSAWYKILDLFDVYCIIKFWIIFFMKQVLQFCLIYKQASPSMLTFWDFLIH